MELIFRKKTFNKRPVQSKANFPFSDRLGWEWGPKCTSFNISDAVMDSNRKDSVQARPIEINDNKSSNFCHLLYFTPRQHTVSYFLCPWHLFLMNCNAPRNKMYHGNELFTSTVVCFCIEVWIAKICRWLFYGQHSLPWLAILAPNYSVYHIHYNTWVYPSI